MTVSPEASNTRSNVVRTSAGHTASSSTKPASTTGLSPELAEQVFSTETNKIFQRINQLEANVPSSTADFVEGPQTIVETLFDARATAKVLFSQVSMHFSPTLRERLFEQIDILHDPDDWEIEDVPIQQKSLTTFLRWFFVSKPNVLPSFGMSDSGHFIASWLANDNRDRLVLEFLPNDKIKWFVTKLYDEDADHSAGITELSRIANILTPYDVNQWFSASS